MRFDVSVSPNESAPKESAKVVLSGSDDRVTQLYFDFTTLLRRVKPPSEAALDLLFVGGIVYALDKLMPRSLADDAWSRLFEVEIPVREPNKWNHVRLTVNDCLGFLTGDDWRVSFIERQSPLIRRRRRKRRARLRLSLASGSTVCLFSGGLDSLVGAIDWLEANPGESLVTVGHHDPNIAGPLSDQKNVSRIVRQHYPMRLSPVFVGIGQTPSGDEISMRSRSLLFVALGVLVADTLGGNVPVLIPENGTIALNVPLTPSRRGSCSTRTAHPYFLKRLQEWLNGVGLQHELGNPLLGKTKGEVVAECGNGEVLRAAVLESVSCAKRGHTRTWKNRSAKGCGRCMPCIYRRAALHKIGLDQEAYGVDVCQGDLDLSDRNSESADDFRACLSFLCRRPSEIDIAKMLVAAGPLNPLEAMGHAATVHRAMQEIVNLLNDKATVDIQQAARLRRGGSRVIA
jgi:7-cyano-7-deazaguanine synthase in queuosine biosynthesis